MKNRAFTLCFVGYAILALASLPFGSDVVATVNSGFELTVGH